MVNSVPDGQSSAGDARIQKKIGEAMKYSLGVQEGEGILIIDRSSKWIADLAYAEAENIGANPEIFVLDQEKAYDKFPDKLIKLVESGKYSKGFSFFTYDDNQVKVDETSARVHFLMGTVKNNSIGLLHSPGIEYDVAANGPVQCDYKQTAADARKLLSAVDGAEKFIITSPSGTDITIGVPKGLKFRTDAYITIPNIYGDKGVFGNFPGGEIWLEDEYEIDTIDGAKSYPIKLIADGKWVCDSTIGMVDKILEPSNPVTWIFENGVLTKTDMKDAAYAPVLLAESAIKYRYGLHTVMHELGIGLNDMAKITKNLLEAEKAKKTAHVAIGNLDFHIDGLTRDPTITSVKEGEEYRLMEKGRVVA